MHIAIWRPIVSLLKAAAVVSLVVIAAFTVSLVVAPPGTNSDDLNETYERLEKELVAKD